MPRFAALLVFVLMMFGIYRLNSRMMYWEVSDLIVETPENVKGSKLLIIPGAGRAYTERPNYQFNGRVTTSIKILKSNPDLKVLVSGFHDGNEYAETSDIANALIVNGVKPERIIYDSSAYDTFQTIINLQHFDTVQTYIFASQPEHLARTLWMAKSTGLNVRGIITEGWPRGTPDWFKARERMACVKARVEVYFYLLTGYRLFSAPE